MDPFIASSQKAIRDTQEDWRTTLEQVKRLENNFSLEEVRVYEDAQLWELVVSACWRLM